MKKVYLALTCIFFATALELSAQQDAQISQHMFAKLAFNPAYAGSNGAYCGTLLYRNQWTGFGGEPKTFLFTGDAYIADISSGVGLTVISDQIGFDKNLGLRAAYAYRLDLGAGKLGLGVDFGMMQKSVDGSKFVFTESGDQSIPTNNVSGSAFDLGFGAYYNTDKMFVGASASHLTEGVIKYDNIKTKLARHYYLQAGYNIDLTSTMTLKPCVLMKTDAASTQLDINTNVLINNKYWAGLSYRLQDAVVIMVGIELIPNLKLGYSYDLTLSDIKTYSSGTHEVMLGYCFKPVKVIHRQFHRNVRFL